MKKTVDKKAPAEKKEETPQALYLDKIIRLLEEISAKLSSLDMRGGF